MVAAGRPAAAMLPPKDRALHLERQPHDSVTEVLAAGQNPLTSFAFPVVCDQSASPSQAKVMARKSRADPGISSSAAARTQALH